MTFMNRPALAIGDRAFSEVRIRRKPVGWDGCRTWFRAETKTNVPRWETMRTSPRKAQLACRGVRREMTHAPVATVGKLLRRFWSVATVLRQTSRREVPVRGIIMTIH
jgi:hypothetical protein